MEKSVLLVNYGRGIVAIGDFSEFDEDLIKENLKGKLKHDLIIDGNKRSGWLFPGKLRKDIEEYFGVSIKDQITDVDQLNLIALKPRMETQDLYRKKNLSRVQKELRDNFFEPQKDLRSDEMRELDSINRKSMSAQKKKRLLVAFANDHQLDVDGSKSAAKIYKVLYGQLTSKQEDADENEDEDDTDIPLPSRFTSREPKTVKQVQKNVQVMSRPELKELDEISGKDLPKEGRDEARKERYIKFAEKYDLGIDSDDTVKKMREHLQRQILDYSPDKKSVAEIRTDRKETEKQREKMRLDVMAERAFDKAVREQLDAEWNSLDAEGQQEWQEKVAKQIVYKQLGSNKVIKKVNKKGPNLKSFEQDPRKLAEIFEKILVEYLTVALMGGREEPEEPSEFDEEGGKITEKNLKKQRAAWKKKQETFLQDKKLQQEKAVALLEKLKEKQNQNYVQQAARLMIFLNPRHYLGQFAKFFQNKFEQNVYTMERLTELDIPDFLPEIFLNPESDYKEKLRIFQGIDDATREMEDRLHYLAKQRVDPTARAKFWTPPPVQMNVKERAVKSICANKSWDIKNANIIVCKEENRFYCLDLQKLLPQLAHGGEAINEFTNGKLPVFVQQNLRERYRKEIEKLENGGEGTVDTHYSEADIQDMQQVLQKLQQIQDLLQSSATIEDSLEKTLGSDLISVLPALVVEAYQNQSAKEAKQFLQQWVAHSIEELQQIFDNEGIKRLKTEEEKLFADSDDDEVEEDDGAEVDEETDDDEEVEEKVVRPGGLPAKHVTERQLIEEHILQGKTLTNLLFQKHLDRLVSSQEQIEQLLEKTRDPGEREKYGALYSKIKMQKTTMASLRQNLDLLIKFVVDHRAIWEQKLAEMNEPQGMSRLYQQQDQARPEDIVAVQKYVDDSGHEVERLQQLKVELDRQYPIPGRQYSEEEHYDPELSTDETPEEYDPENPWLTQ